MKTADAHNKDVSKNERAGRVMGFRLKGQPIDFPCELGYQCPACKIGWDEGLEWSEYRGFLWCEKCNKDYPSVICYASDEQGVLKKSATDIFLDCVEEALTAERERITKAVRSEREQANATHQLATLNRDGVDMVALKYYEGQVCAYDLVLSIINKATPEELKAQKVTP